MLDQEFFSSKSAVSKLVVVDEVVQGGHIIDGTIEIHFKANTLAMHESRRNAFQLYVQAHRLPITILWDRNLAVCTDPTQLEPIIKLLKKLSLIDAADIERADAFFEKNKAMFPHVRLSKLNTRVFEQSALALARSYLDEILDMLTSKVPPEKAATLMRYVLSPAYKDIHLATWDFILKNEEVLPRELLKPVTMLQDIAQGYLHMTYAKWNVALEVNQVAGIRSVMVNIAIRTLLEKYRNLDDVAKFKLAVSILSFDELNLIARPETDLDYETRCLLHHWSITTRSGWAGMWKNGAMFHPKLDHVFGLLGVKQDVYLWDVARLAVIGNAFAGSNILYNYIHGVRQLTALPATLHEEVTHTNNTSTSTTASTLTMRQ